jgi:hypothetical protein
MFANCSVVVEVKIVVEMVFLIVEVISKVEVVLIVVLGSSLFTVSVVYSEGPNIIATRIMAKKTRKMAAIIFLIENNDSPF